MLAGSARHDRRPAIPENGIITATKGSLQKNVIKKKERNSLIESIVSCRLINIQSHSVKTRNLQIMHSHISLHIVVREIRHDLLKYDVIVVLGIVSCKVVAVNRNFLIR